MVSVIIPVYNAEKFLEESIESILKQTYADLEILICDDKSTDNSLAIAKRFNDKRIKMTANETNRGYLRTVNRLAEQTTGDFIAFQDADDISHPMRIELQLQEFAKNKNLGIVGTNYAVINPLGAEVLRQNVESNLSTLMEALKTRNPFQKPSILFRREVYNSIGMFREGFLKLGNISEDYDWILRASELFEVGNVNYTEPLYNYRSVPGAMTKSYTTLEQLFGHTIAQHLADERKKLGLDSLDKGDYSSLKELIEKLKTPYLRDKSLFFQEKAAMYMYYGLKLEAIKSSFDAIKIEPARFENYRLLLYCFRKWILKR